MNSAITSTNAERPQGLSQADLAAELGVSSKAVSKWENGKAKPTTDTLRKLGFIFNVSVDKLMSLQKVKEERRISKIVITGGPSAGKTTAMSWIQNAFTKKGYAVLFVPETATELITGGVTSDTCGSNTDFQKCLMRLQREKEQVFRAAAESMPKKKVLIVCDRGMLDNKAYMSPLEFTGVLNETGASEVELRDSYDAVFHLVTAAKGAKKFYTTANNSARRETPEEAAALDDRLIAAWTGHPHLRVIDNSTGFEEKMKRLIAEINAFLGEPEPFEIERKFMIEYPDIRWLESLTNCKPIEIIQTYLKSDNGDEVRVRQRGADGSYIYFQTTKHTVNGIRRIETERRLSASEYLRLLMEADTTKRQIRKTRYCLTYENHYFEIDIYPFWSDRAILEIELKDEKEAFSFPKGIKVLKEVTDDINYKNASLAKI